MCLVAIERAAFPDQQSQTIVLCLTLFLKSRGANGAMVATSPLFLPYLRKSSRSRSQTRALTGGIRHCPGVSLTGAELKEFLQPLVAHITSDKALPMENCSPQAIGSVSLCRYNLSLCFSCEPMYGSWSGKSRHRQGDKSICKGLAQVWGEARQIALKFAAFRFLAPSPCFLAPWFPWVYAVC